MDTMLHGSRDFAPVPKYIFRLDFVQMHMSGIYPAMTVKYFGFSFSDLKTSADAPQRELILRTTFVKIAKGLDHLSANTPRWIIDLSVRQWRNYFWQYSVNPDIPPPYSQHLHL